MSCFASGARASLSLAWVLLGSCGVAAPNPEPASSSFGSAGSGTTAASTAAGSDAGAATAGQSGGSTSAPGVGGTTSSAGRGGGGSGGAAAGSAGTGAAAGGSGGTGGTPSAGDGASGATPFGVCTGTPKKAVTIYMIGDSTMSVYASNLYPRMGWGQPLGSSFAAKCATVVDKALSGRSSKSFLEEGAWTPVKSALKAGDYVLIQFGHNDEKSDDPTRYTEPKSTYKQFLTAYVADTRAKSATPLLLTSVNRNKWSGAALSDTHGEYPAAVRELAASLEVELIDLTALSKSYFERIGQAETNRLFLILSPGQSANYPSGVTDNTHFQERGALVIGQLAMADAYTQVENCLVPENRADRALSTSREPINTRKVTGRARVEQLQGHVAHFSSLHSEGKDRVSYRYHVTMISLLGALAACGSAGDAGELSSSGSGGVSNGGAAGFGNGGALAGDGSALAGAAGSPAGNGGSLQAGSGGAGGAVAGAGTAGATGSAGNAGGTGTWNEGTELKAFPTAEGYGRLSKGGRGGRVIKVSNLNDSGAGSLRAAVEATGARTVVFDVGGVINLKSKLVIRKENALLTIAGQTAPGKGVVVHGWTFGLIGGADVVLRFIRTRVGTSSGETMDGMGITGADANNVIYDHCSISWTIDEAFSSRGASNFTLQRTLISEALNEAGHEKYPAGTQHGYAASIGGDIGTFHHNLLAHCSGRNFSLAGGLAKSPVEFSGRLDIRNNVVYNWKSRTTDGGAHAVNFVNNYYKPGPASEVFVALNAQIENFPGTQSYFFSGNVMPGRFDESSQDKGRKISYINRAGADWDVFVDEPFFDSYVSTQSAGAAYEDVLANVGANVPVLDDHDKRVIDETRKGSYKYSGSKTKLPGLPDREADVGGLESYPEAKRPADWDTDADGMPNAWESAHGLNPAVSADGNAKTLSKVGYTNLEMYLNELARDFD